MIDPNNIEEWRTHMEKFPMLCELYYEGVLSVVEIKDGVFRVREEADRYISLTLSPRQLRNLGEELIQLSYGAVK